MAKKLIFVGATDQTVDVFIQDSSSTTGAGLTGLVFNSAGLICYYRKGATGSATQLSLATQTVGGAHSDGGFVEISSANMPGFYRLDLSDTIVAALGSATLTLHGATDMAQSALELQMVAFNPEAALATPTNITAGTITTVTNLTNAPTNGDFTATMKTSLNAATPVATLAGSAITAIWTTALTESYAANGVQFTGAQGLYAVHQYLQGFDIINVNYSVKKLDQTTEAFLVTMNSASSPTAATRA